VEGSGVYDGYAMVVGADNPVTIRLNGGVISRETTVSSHKEHARVDKAHSASSSTPS